MSEPQVILIDGTGYLFRAFHALPPLTNKDGRPTGAIYGMSNMLRKLQKKYPNGVFIVVFDAPGPTFRDKLYPAYKAQRAAMPDELRSQIEPVKRMVKAMGLPVLEQRGVEADDVIGTLATIKDDDQEVLICTSDKDMAQLVNERVQLLDERKDQVLDRQAVFDKFSVWPEQIVDFLALAGDSADNIPGVPKVGPKTAAKWLQTYQNIDGVIQSQAEIGGVVGKNLRGAVADGTLALSKKLATIDCDVKLNIRLNDLRATEPHVGELSKVYEYMGSKRLLEELSPKDPFQKPDENAPSYAFLSDAAVPAWVEEIQEAGVFACHVLHDEANKRQTGLVGIALSCQTYSACYLPANHGGLSSGRQINKELFRKCLGDLFENSKLRVLSTNGKLLLHLLKGYGMKCRAQLEDVGVLAYVLGGAEASKDLDELAQRRLDIELMSQQDLLGKGRDKLTYAQSSPVSAATFAGGRANAAFQLYQQMAPELSKINQLDELYAKLELPMVRVLARMEQHGARIDPDILRRQAKELASELTSLQENIWALAGHEFNINSTQQLQKVLFEEQQLPIIKKSTKTKAPSTDEGVLSELAADYELPNLLLRYRSLVKLKSTYLDKLPDDINPRTGRIHTSFHQMAASTGRLSSMNPNLQNIPIRTDEGRKVRQAFIPADNKILLSADYSQIELRVMAHIAKDEGMLAAFRNNQDIHRTTAAGILSIPLEEVSDDQRRDAKTVNFGLIYGMGSFSLGKQLGITQPAAQNYIDDYFKRYPGVQQYMTDVLESTKELGYAKTLFGRRMFFPKFRSARGAELKAIERAIINAPIQGTAADIIKRAMVRIDAWLKDEAGLDSVAMILQVHDELVFEVARKHLAQLEAGLHEHMTGAASLDVPLEINIGQGANWLEAH